jgi:hypothetical protein
MTKLIPATIAALLLTAAAATAQTPPPAAPAAAPAGALTLDTPIEDIAANPAGKAILDKDMPGLTTHPAYDQFKGMSLKEVQPMSQGAITDDMMTKTGADLATMKK